MAIILAKPLHGGRAGPSGNARHACVRPDGHRPDQCRAAQWGLPRLEAAVSLRKAASTRPVGLAAGRESEILQVYDG